jgi:pantetheine-phosphate adenylyltransferase
MGVVAVFPGTFDPIHYGHMDIARRSAAIFEKVIVAVYDKPLKSLLFSPEERLQLVNDVLGGVPGVEVTGYHGLTVQFCQAVGAQVIVRGLRVFSDFEHEFRMALANHRLAPEIEVCALVTREEHTFLSSSTVREIASLGGDVSSLAPAPVVAALKRRYQALGDDGWRAGSMTSLRD